MKIKDLGYSIKQVQNFLSKMENVFLISENSYTFKNASIKLEINPLNPQSFIKIERCFMTLDGNAQDYEEFYNKFLLHHMTIGG